VNESRLRLLLVDDDAEVSWAVGRFMARSGFAVSSCGDGAEAVRLLEASAFDVVVTDVQMPNINGLALIEWIRDHRPRTRVVVITAYGSPSVRALALRKGAVLYLEKPVDPQILVDVLGAEWHEDTFSGSIDDIDLFDYLQLMILSRKQVIVEILARSGESGIVYLDKGDVTHAACGEAEGEAAFFRCLAFEGGTFATRPWRPPERRSVGARGDFLLMEAARLKDEAAHEVECAGRREVPRGAAALVETAGGGPDADDPWPELEGGRRRNGPGTC
jgi:CheY-like chemotaxis protein